MLIYPEELEKVYAELLNQWECNHAEHCGHVFIAGTYEHVGGACYWEMPEVLKAYAKITAAADSSLIRNT